MLTELEKRALRLYKAPFRYQHGYIFDADGHTVSDTPEEITSGAAARIRGWGRMSHMEEPARLQDALGELVARSLTKYWNETVKELQFEEKSSDAV